MADAGGAGRLLFLSPDLLLLDEPTNHLDLEATIWLESYLATYPGTIILVSHDRVCSIAASQIAHVSEGRLRLYTGDYDNFERQRALQMEIGAKAKAKQDAKRAHLSAFVERFRAKASKAKQAQSRQKMLEKMEVAVINAERTLPITFPNPDPLPSPLLTLEDASVGYGGAPILKRINFQLGHEDRLAFWGKWPGQIHLAEAVGGGVVGCRRQDARIGQTACGLFRPASGRGTGLKRNTHPGPQPCYAQRQHGNPDAQPFGRLWLEDKATTRIGDLSGGQKARLLLALMSFDRPHILLLDEPTNHLDMDSRQALVEAIQMFEGAVILVSHDPDW